MKRVLSMEAWEYPDEELAKMHCKIMQSQGYHADIFIKNSNGSIVVKYQIKYEGDNENE